MGIQDKLEIIAGEYRKIRKLPVIGIVGSYGKTTTKELTAALLEEKYCVHKNIGSNNGNETVLRNTLDIQPEHEVCVFEMGIDDFGQMEKMAACCRPTIPVLTGLGEAHLEKLGTIELMYQEKSHVLDTLPLGGKVIANGDDPRLMEYLRSDKRLSEEQIFTYGLSKDCMLRAENISLRGLHGSTFMVCGEDFLEYPFEVKLRLPGQHMIQDALCAILLGILFQLSTEQIQKKMKQAVIPEQRCQVLHTEKLTVIDDTYNASPVSAIAALELLRQVPERKVCILGDMEELGDDTLVFHREIGRKAAEVSDEVICIGKLAKEMFLGAEQSSGRGRNCWYAGKEDFLQNPYCHIRENDTILIKASHKHGFHKIAEVLIEN